MSRLLAVLGCLCAVAALAHSAAVPTQDTMVVAKSDDTTATPTPSVDDITTEESSPPIKLTEMDVISDVSLRYAHTTVVAKVRNPAKKAQEANFRVLLPETAFISGFVMTLDGKSYKAYVKEKEEAKQIYQDAVNQGLGAAHISAKARDSNHFTVSVNVEASSNAVFNLTYEELLVRRNGVYNHAINLHPGALVPKLTVTVNIKETEKLVELRVPEIRTGNEIDATKDDAQNLKAAITRAHDDREATITFSPDLQEQERLIQIYAQKAKESAASSHSYPSWSSYSEPEEAAPEGVLGQFVVQYDVARPKDGEILVNDGYFVHFFAPTELPPLNKFVVFVLDTSGSMMERKIIQLREAMQTILGELNEGDYFSIVEFSSTVTVHDLKEAEGEPPKHSYSYSYFDYHDKGATLVPPSKATKENINKAKVIVSWLQASGGTNIGKALDVAVELINKGVDWTVSPPAAAANATEASGPTPEAVTTEATSTTQAAATTEVGEKKEPKNLEPIIIFLTDGDPTVGVTDPKRIITLVQEKNSGPSKATIFSLAFGEDADRKFLRKLSLRNGGFMRHIYEAADAALQLRDFYRQISSPLLADLKFTYPTGQVKSDSLTQHSFRTYYAGSELVVAGQLADGAAELQPSVLAFCGVGDAGYGRKRYEIVPKVPVEKKKSGYLPLERLWSYLTIKQLLDQRDAADASDTEDKDKSPEKTALALALKYEFVTPLTSLVVVKPNATNAVNAESVDKAAGAGGYPSGIPLSVSLAGRPMASHASQAFSSSYGGGFGAGLPGAPGHVYPAAASASFAGSTGYAGGGHPSLDKLSVPAADFLEEEVEEYVLEDSGIAAGHSYLDSRPVFYRLSALRPANSAGPQQTHIAAFMPQFQKMSLRGVQSYPAFEKNYDVVNSSPISSPGSGLAAGQRFLPHALALSVIRRPASSTRDQNSQGAAFIMPTHMIQHSFPAASNSDILFDYDYDADVSNKNRLPGSGLAAGQSFSYFRPMPASIDFTPGLMPTSLSSNYNYQGSAVMPQRMDVPSYSTLDSGPISYSDSYSTTPVPFSLPFVPTTSRPSASSSSRPSLAELHLEGFTWLEALLDASADNIVLPTNDTSVTLKLSKDSVAPKEASGDAECASAVDGGSGLCVYLSRCDAAKDITVDVYRTTYCTLSQGYAGVCCPQKKVDLTH